MTEHVEEGQGAQPSLQEIIDKKPIADFTEDAGREQAHQQAREEREKPPERAPKPQREQQKPEQGFVPLREVLDEREKRQRAEAEAQRYRAWIEDQQRKIAAEQDNDLPPDMFKDPNAYSAWIDRQVERKAKSIADQYVQPLQAQVSDYAIRMSEMQARARLGERFAALEEWVRGQSDDFKQWALSQPDPWAAAHAQYRQRTTFERLGDDDLDGYEAKLRAKWEAEQAAKQPRIADQSDDEEDFDEPQQSRARMPRTFAAGRSAEPTTAGRAAHAGPKPLGEILKERPARSQRGR
jgi:hypothetical protein